MSTAHADPEANDQVARQHYDHGKELAAEGKFASAFGEFSAGYDASPRALFLFNMAECQRALGNANHARELYEKFLAASPNDALAPTAKARLSELPAPAPAPRAEPPVAKPVPPPATAVRPAEVAPAAPTNTAPVTIATAPTTTDSSHSLVAPIAFGAGALVLGGVALGLDLTADSTYNQSTHATGTQQTSLWQTANQERFAAGTVGIVGAASAGVAVWLYIRDQHRDREASARRTHVVPTPGGMAVLGSF